MLGHRPPVRILKDLISYNYCKTREEKVLSGSILISLFKVETTNDFPTFLLVPCLQGSLEVVVVVVVFN